MYVCMCAYVCMCVYVRMYVCMYLYVCMYMCVCMYVCMLYVCMYVCMCVYVVCMCLYVCVYAGVMCVCVSVCSLFLIQVYFKYEPARKFCRKFGANFQDNHSQINTLGQKSENNRIADRQESRQETNSVDRREIGSYSL